MIEETKYISIKNASEHNLKNISLEIPHNKFVVVVGVSGSGKSSLAFDIIAKEGQRRYMETFSSFSRQFMGKISSPKVESITGLSPVITISQKTTQSNSRSTVGTMCDAFDYLKLLFARLGKSDNLTKLTKSNFSFNTLEGACERCKGLGLEEDIALDLLVANPNLTLREGALVPTLPNGYIMYSQVTIDVLNTVCEAHGFNVDIRWKDLTEAQKNIILNGSDRLKVPFGKHSLESRLKWTGIKAKPREEGYYKGMLPIMRDILKRDRNKNILRFVKSATCSSCNGNRLKPEILNIKIRDIRFKSLLNISISEVKHLLITCNWGKDEKEIAAPIVKKIDKIITRLEDLGLGHLSFNRNANNLSGGEAQRLRIANQISSELSNVLYIFDEPSIGLHRSSNNAMLAIFKELIANGNSVIVVEHDLETIKNADWIIDIGPNAGIEGGKLLFNGSLKDYENRKDLKDLSLTWQVLFAPEKQTNRINRSSTEKITIKNCATNNLENVTVDFQKSALNVVTGKSGAGKSSLVNLSLAVGIEQILKKDDSKFEIEGLETIKKIIKVDQKPIGRTPRSNPATYTGIADKIRDLYAKQEKAKALNLKKTHFSFNSKGGRCESCLGAGEIQIGMHFLSNVSTICSVCEGKRFNPKPLEVKVNGLSIHEVLLLSVNEAILFFSKEPTLLKQLKTLEQVGLGYIKLGQSCTTLSGGEAQRIKLATELQKSSKGDTLYILDEPSTGLHEKDIEKLLLLLKKLINQGNTVICIEHNEQIIETADCVIVLDSGKIVPFDHFAASSCLNSQSNNELVTNAKSDKDEPLKRIQTELIKLSGVTTNALKNIDVEFRKNKLNIITGVSGSGKSSLAIDTLYSEAFARFSESLTSYARGLIRQGNEAHFDKISGLGPVILIDRKSKQVNNRSTVGTITNIYDSLRLLYSRIAQQEGYNLSAQHFSFNHELGSCTVCDGLGYNLVCDPELLIKKPELSINDGVFNYAKACKYYANPNGQFISTLKAVAKEEGIDLDLAWNKTPQKHKDLVLYGTNAKEYTSVWKFKNKTREGEQEIKAVWKGFCNYINEEYLSKIHNKNTSALTELLSRKVCKSCNGNRLKHAPLQIKWQGLNIAEICELSISNLIKQFASTKDGDTLTEKLITEVKHSILSTLKIIEELGLGYLSLSRIVNTLSGGECQRLKLAGQLSTQLYGVTYVLDEPSVGLHASNVKALLQIIKRIINIGNTVIIIEHDPKIIEQGDYILEIGPEAGIYGGKVIASGNIASIQNNANSIIRNYIGKKFCSKTKATKNGQKFGVRELNKYGLKNLEATFYSEGINVLTGKSGSGKSTLFKEIVSQSKNTFGLTSFSKIISIDQNQLNLSGLSTPATLLNLMDEIRDLFSKITYAKENKLTKSAFSYNHKSGKCTRCNGNGVIRTAMDYMQDITTTCNLCQGKRYLPLILECKYKSLSIADILNLTLSEAGDFFSDNQKLLAKLKLAKEAGLGYLKLGQQANSLSSGEAQRIKLAAEINSSTIENALFIFDEPSAGLHPLDIEQLLVLISTLVKHKNTVIYIEHNEQMISNADWEVKI